MSNRKWLAVRPTQEHRNALVAAKIRFREMEICTGKKGAVIGFQNNPENRERFLAGLKSDTRILAITEFSALKHDEVRECREPVVYLEIEILKLGDVEEVRNKYLNQCDRSFYSKAEELQGKIDSAASDIKNRQRDLVERIRKFNTNRAGLKALRERFGSEQKEKICQNFDALVKVSHVRGLAVDSEKISIITDRICMGNRDIGEFKIDIYFDAGILGFRNLTRRIDNHYDHPHVLNGAANPGNLSETCPKLIADHQFATVATLAIKYLCSYNAANALCPIERWPEEAKKK